MFRPLGAGESIPLIRVCIEIFQSSFDGEKLSSEYLSGIAGAARIVFENTGRRTKSPILGSQARVLSVERLAEFFSHYHHLDEKSLEYILQEAIREVSKERAFKLNFRKPKTLDEQMRHDPKLEVTTTEPEPEFMLEPPNSAPQVQRMVVEETSPTQKKGEGECPWCPGTYLDTKSRCPNCGRDFGDGEY